MPGMNQLGGALSVNPAPRDAGGGEAANARPTDSKKSPDPTPADAVKSATEAQRVRGETADQKQRQMQRRTRKFSQLRSRGRKDPITGDMVNITNAAKKARAESQQAQVPTKAEQARITAKTNNQRAENFDNEVAPKSARFKASLARAMDDLHAARPRAKK